MPGPLTGIRIVDVSEIVSGPMCTMLLAEQGADVTKIEPLVGDGTRVSGNERAGMQALFANCNRGKRGISLDLSTDQGKKIVHDLVKSADVFVQNWRPGAAERLGLGEEALRALNSDLIYATVSGYGPSGPLRDERVYDPIIQAQTGQCAIQKNPEIPIRDLMRQIVVDKATALTLAQAITAALFARDRGAGGQSIHVPMIDTGLWFMFPDGGMKHTMLGDDIVRPFSLYETYRLWETSNGQVCYFLGSPDQLPAAIRALGDRELSEDPRFQKDTIVETENYVAFGEALEKVIRKLTTEEVVQRFRAEHLPVSAVVELDEAFDSEQVRHNGIVHEEEHPAFGRYRFIDPPARFTKTPADAASAPPLLGEHNDAVLGELGMSSAEIAKLREQGILG